MAPDRLGEPVSDEPARPPERRTLEGTFVVLEPLSPLVHVDGLWAASHAAGPDGNRIWTYMPYGPFEDAADMRDWMTPLAASQDPLYLTVVSRKSGDPVGMASFLNVDVGMRHLELGHIWYGPRAQHTEANTEAAFLMLREAFEELGHRRVEWKCDALNVRSRAAAERLGFTFEGVFRQHMIVKGRNRDTAWFAMLDADWPEARKAFEAWLAADPNGRPPLASLRSSA